VRYNPRAMRRLFRILINALTALLLLLFIATVALWVRSYSIGDYLYSTTRTKQAGAVSTAGLVLLYDYSTIGYVTFDPPHGIIYSTRDQPEDLRGYVPPNTRQRFRLMGFVYVSGTNGSWTERCWMFPHWFVAILFSATPSLWLCRRLQKRRQPRPLPDMRLRPPCHARPLSGVR
jgi:hypothetical protein